LTKISVFHFRIH